MSIVYVSALIKAAPEKGDALQAVLAGVVAEVRSEKGCIRYDLHRCVEPSSTFLFYETWESQADLDAHGKTPHMVRMREAMGPLLGSEPEVLVYSAVDVAH